MTTILWSTDPQTNLEGGIADAGALLEESEDGFDLNYWDGVNFGTIHLSDADARALLSVLSRVLT